MLLWMDYCQNFIVLFHQYDNNKDTFNLESFTDRLKKRKLYIAMKFGRKRKKLIHPNDCSDALAIIKSTLYAANLQVLA